MCVLCVYRSDSDRRNNRFGSVARILSTAILFTVVATFVWVRSDRVTVKDSVNQTTSSEQEWVWTSTPVAIQEPTGERAPRHRPHAEQSRVTMRSQNADVFHDNRLEIGPSMSQNRTPLLFIRGRLIKKIPYSTYHRGNTAVDENLNTFDTSRILHKMDIRLNHKQINNYDYPIIQIDEPIADKEVLSNNQNAYDLTYDVSGKGSEENKNSIDRISWTTFFNKSGQIIPRRLWLLKTPEKSGSLDQPPFGLRTHYQNTKDLEYRLKHDVNRDHKIPERQLMKSFSLTNEFDFKTQPVQQDSLILQPPNIPNVENNISSSPQKTIIKTPLINERIWRRISLMAFIKLVLVKLKTIGFIKILFLILFKLKFVLMVLFFKFFSILKLVKFSILQLLFFPLVAFIFLITMKAFPAYTLLMNTLDINNNPTIFSNLNTPITNNEKVLISPETMSLIETLPFPSSETILIPSSETILIPSSETILIPSSDATLIPSNNLLLPAAPTIPGRSPIQIIPNSNIPFGVDNINFLGGLQYEPLEVLDPTLDLFQNELNSETCVERIACKIAATGKTGIIPMWINRILHEVSRPVPNEKLLYYLKAYDDVINEIQTKSPNPDNWETWCFERYDCSNTDNR